MSFFDFLEKVRSKPRYIRIQILVVLACVSMSVIVFFWVVSLKGSFSGQQANVSDLTESLGGLRGGLPSLKSAFSDMMSAVFKKSQSELKQNLGSETKNESKKEQESTTESKPARLPLR